jgi:hypothetical protein
MDELEYHQDEVYDEIHQEEVYDEYLSSHPAYDYALCKVLNWINTQEELVFHRKEMYRGVSDMRFKDGQT